ncbi:hypothetical protein [Pseudoalteromonas sp. L1]|uniref:hypothetical protein n=1 Tax=Pseudoalteromonas sp. L1 TaxID=195716 RepID=UPI001F287583|nr:hypothetical protein [Pseudoalteromonas sp. L1]
MIFTSLYRGTKGEVYKRRSFKSYSLNSAEGPYLYRSLNLIHSLYGNWLKRENGFYIVPFEMCIDRLNLHKSEAAIDLFFYKLQMQFSRYLSSDNDRRIGMVFTTDFCNREMARIIHSGYFLTDECDEEKLVGALNYCTSHVTDYFGDYIDVEFNELAPVAIHVLADRFDTSRDEGFRILCSQARVLPKDVGYTGKLMRVRYGFHGRS